MGTCDGQFGSYCCDACKDGNPCKVATHTNPAERKMNTSKPTSYSVEQPATGKFMVNSVTCKRKDCPCVSTFNNKDNEYCCKRCREGNACPKKCHWTICHGTVLACAEKIKETGFKQTSARTGELGEGIYGTCVHPQTEKDQAGESLEEEVEKAKRFAHDYDLRFNDGKQKGPTNVPVLVVVGVNLSRVKVFAGSDPDPDGVPEGDVAAGRVSEWKREGFQACWTSKTDGVRDPWIKTTLSEICFRRDTKIGAMRVVRLDKNGFPQELAKRPCRYKEAGFRCPCEM